ncbi:YncE family protein [Pseudomonas sp. EpS/L25]|uniref:YncE family protein n=1 Tax=Pseudomonas sp. EpS/L25 TaxID=1749078 RepID=UPI0007432E58|nr:YncE family protein [Pseudomonas sp. EpS/L25]KUM37895.1 hypothetical protein AR540_14080 [Pseudomonas sp. EpS/L25]
MSCRALTSLATALLLSTSLTQAAQVPLAAAAPDIPLDAQDRVYTADQFSNTVSVIDPATATLLGVISLGDSQPNNLSPLYRGELLVHGLGFAPDGRTLAAVAIGSNAVTFIDTTTNQVKGKTYLGRAPHEAFFTPDGKELWVTVRGEDYIAVIDPQTFHEITRIKVPVGPGMQIFSPDGQYGYVCSSFTPETVVIAVAKHQIVGRVPQASPFCPNIAASPDGQQVWFTLKDVGKTQVFAAKPPFGLLKTLDTGPITNHVNLVRNAKGSFAYVTVGGENRIKVFRTADFTQVASIPVGALPHGLWPSGDGTRLYVGLENADTVAVIDTLTNQVVGTLPVGQAPQALVYVPRAVAKGGGKDGLQPLRNVAKRVQIALAAPDKDSSHITQVTLFDQGLTQVLQASVTGLAAKQPYVLALATQADGHGPLESLAAFQSNPAGAAIVNAVGPIRQLVQGRAADEHRYLVIAPGTPDAPGAPVQVQVQ